MEEDIAAALRASRDEVDVDKDAKIFL